jgi:hypothetical protein
MLLLILNKRGAVVKHFCNSVVSQFKKLGLEQDSGRERYI